jgi:23S rRNA (pseudouridine1915-N3)-methyltransferase
LKLVLLAVGRLGQAPETLLAKDYLQRATLAGRSLGLGPAELIEVEARKPGKAAEAEVLRPHFTDSHVVLCDEHGVQRPSRDLALRIGRLRDDGVRRMVFVIGGADGLDPGLEAQEKLALGVQTWPHALVRAMMAEQIYRAATILAGSPYHRD